MRVKVSERELLNPGYRRAYVPPSQKMEHVSPGESRLAGLKRGQRIKPKSVRARRLGMDEAGLIDALQKHQIGRPATYSLIIETLLQRRYVERGLGGALDVTPRGRAVLEFLLTRYPKLFSIEFTAGMERTLDQIANGEKTYEQGIAPLWKTLNHAP
jgi:DNA topoisomerase-1